MIHLIYKTASGNKYPLTMQYKLVTPEQVCFEPERILEFCKSGCSNYGVSGGCPPRAPLFSTIIQGKKQVVVITCKFDSVYKPLKVLHSKNSAIHWKFQNGILAIVLNRLGYQLAAKVGGTFLATGYCKGCPGKKCTFKLGIEECRNPHLRTYSMEATGIDVVQTVKKIFASAMYWYRKGYVDVPYMLKCIAFIPEQILDEKEVDTIMQRALSTLGSITIGKLL